MNLFNPVIRYLPSPCNVVNGTLGILEPAPKVDGQNARNNLLQIKSFAEDRKIQDRIRLVTNQAQIGRGWVSHYSYHHGNSVILSGGILKPFKIVLPIRQAVAYAVEPDAVQSSERLDVTVQAHKKMVCEGDLELLEKIFHEDSYLSRAFCSLGVASGAGLATWTIVSPASVLAAAALIGLTTITATEILIGALALSTISLTAYGILRYTDSQTAIVKATKALVGLPGIDRVDTAAELAINRLERLIAANKKNPRHIVARAIHHMNYTREGELRFFRTWDSSLKSRITLLENLR